MALEVRFPYSRRVSGYPGHMHGKSQSDCEAFVTVFHVEIRTRRVRFYFYMMAFAG
jgi:hypothetical protein